jgi:hypothetical protein
MDDLNIPHSGPRAGFASASYRVQRRTSMDASTRRLALLSGGLGGILVLIVGFWSVSGHRDGAIPVIQADRTPLRVKPENPGGMQVSNLNEDFLSGTGDTKVQATAPAPEQPDPKALRAQAVPVKPAPAATITAPPPAPAAVARPAPAPVVARPAVATRPAPVAVVERAEPAPSTGHGPQVQLGALSSEQAAHAEWERLSRRMPGLLARRRPEVARADINGRVYWRLRTAGFQDAAQASNFCEQVRQMGGDCSVAAF